MWDRMQWNRVRQNVVRWNSVRCVAALALLLAACRSDVPADTLESLATRFRQSQAPTDLEAAVRSLPASADAARVRALLGEPLVVSQLADGGESWLYVKSDAAKGQGESISLLLSPQGRFLRLVRKPID